MTDIDPDELAKAFHRHRPMGGCVGLVFILPGLACAVVILSIIGTLWGIS